MRDARCGATPQNLSSTKTAHTHIFACEKINAKQINGVSLLLLLLFFIHHPRAPAEQRRRMKKSSRKYLEDIKLITVDVELRVIISVGCYDG